MLCDLSQFGTLRVSGEEAQPFLQNLLSNDIREVSSTRAQLSSLNTAKGRMLATMLIWREGDDYLLQLPRSLCESIRKKLSMYVLRAKVKVTDASDEIISTRAVRRECAGDFARAIRRTAATPVRLHRHRTRQRNKYQRHALADQHPRYTRRRTVGGTQPACAAGRQYLLGLAQHPFRHTGHPAATQEQFVAQMVNLELIGGVNFKKGCYPGQEIVARMQYLGKLKRRMFLAHMDCSDAPQAGDELFSADMEGQASGMIVNAAPAPGGGYDVLASVQTSSRETHTVHWKSLQGAELQFLPLPYPVARCLSTAFQR